MDQPACVGSAKQQLVHQQIYEYRKGVRQLAMITMTTADMDGVVALLSRENIEHYVHGINNSRINLFFGRSAMVETTRKIVTKPLSFLSPEEDFMLGTMLGYDREEQCKRYLAKTQA